VNEVVKNPNPLLLLFSPPRSRRRRSSNLRLQIHLRHQFQQFNHTSTSTHKNSTIFTVEKSSNNLFKREAEPVDYQGSNRETKSGSEED